MLHKLKKAAIEIVRAIKLSADSHFDHQANLVESKPITEAEISDLIASTEHLPLSNLANWEKSMSWKWQQVANHSQGQDCSPLLADMLNWIGLCSSNGYQRERSLQTISGAAPNRIFLALALRRLNDWVPQVREAARQILPQLAQATDPEQVAQVLCVILPHWQSWGRMEAADKHVLLAITALEKVKQALKSQIVSNPAGPMATILTQVGRTQVLDQDLAEIAQQAIQPSVRARAYRFQLEGKVVWLEGREWEWTNIQYCKGHLKPVLRERKLRIESSLLETLSLAVADPSAAVRRVAAEMLIRNLETIAADAPPLAAKLAIDPSPSVAEQGAFLLKKMETNVKPSAPADA